MFLCCSVFNPTAQPYVLMLFCLKPPAILSKSRPLFRPKPEAARRSLSGALSAEGRNDLVEAVGHGDEVCPPTADEAATLQVVEHVDGPVPEALHVVEHHTLAVVADGVRGRHGEHLVERADAARQSDEHIAVEQDQVFAVAEVVAGDVYIHIVAHPA